tara:strand:- start:574 stop:1107 length:534 start_codon:yes stop_codon:yes gene_type:complete
MTDDTLRRPPYSFRRAIIWIAIITALLCIPFIAMQLTGEVDWTAGDFVFAGLIFGAVATGYELAARAAPNGWYRLGAGLALLIGLFTVWSNLAVGIVGSEDNAVNQIFFLIPLAAIIGTAFVRGRADGMARVMGVAALLQLLTVPTAILWDQRVIIFLIVLSVGWLASAWCFRRAAR